MSDLPSGRQAPPQALPVQAPSLQPPAQAISQAPPLRFDINAELKKLPGKPGVYIMKSAAGDIIYVGKAVSLKNRVKQYFQSNAGHTPKVRALVLRICSFEYIVTDTEFEALILECNLIKKHRPRYNVLLKDDKHYPYIKITVGEEYPRVVMTRRIADDGAKYYGPYLNTHSIYDTIHELRKVFPLKSCKKELPRDIGKGRPCLNCHLGLCLGPCSGSVAQPEYLRAIKDVCLFLDGRHDDIVKALENDMRAAADDMRYELAGKLRDKLFALRHIQEKQKVLSTASYDQDAIAYYSDSVDTCVSIFFIRGGKLVGREQFLFEGSGAPDAGGLLSGFVKQFYAGIGFVPREIILQEPIEDMALIEKMLSDAKGSKVSIHVPARGEKRLMAQMVQKNAELELTNKKQTILAEKTRIREGIAALSAMLGISLESDGARVEAAGGVGEDGSGGANGGAADGGEAESASDDESGGAEATAGIGAEGGAEVAAAGKMAAARAEDGAEAAAAGEMAAGGGEGCRIEAYDISNYGDENKTASMIVFEDGVPAKSEYRRFMIRSVQGQDDYACMQEALHRRLRNLIDGKAKFAKRPALILVDGGKGHVSSALEVLGGLGLDIPVAGMAKNDRHETNAIVTAAGEERPLAPFPQLFRLISSIQDEAHRFAISYSKKLSEKRLSLSALDDIRGVGKQRKMALLVHFKSFAHIREASAEELAKVPGVDERTAGNIYRYFHGDSEPPPENEVNGGSGGSGAAGATGVAGAENARAASSADGASDAERTGSADSAYGAAGATGVASVAGATGATNLTG
ncbi:MAG: excinuclease ABC subunit UvrC, partial [Clostridiales bacterium]|nr:excinuclease ABC subunit UvrC [Clostridiales bacterium]